MPILHNPRKLTGATGVAYKYILENITSGKWKPGMYIQEKEICQEIGVSRTPIREACVHLISENYLEKTQNSRIRVALISEKQLLEVYKVRSILEEKIIEELIVIFNEEHEVELATLITYLDSATSSGNKKEVFRLMDEFHHYLAKVLNNSILLDILNMINGHIARYRSLLYDKVTQVDMDSIKDNHREIYKLILSRNTEEAKKHLVKWNEISMKFIRKRLKDSGYL